MEKFLVDYSSPVFKFPYEQDGSRYYATFHPELAANDQGSLEYTGRFFIVTVTLRGIFHFHIEKGGSGSWISEDASMLVDPDLIQWCGERIEARDFSFLSRSLSA